MQCPARCGDRPKEIDLSGRRSSSLGRRQSPSACTVGRDRSVYRPSNTFRVSLRSRSRSRVVRFVPLHAVFCPRFHRIVPTAFRAVQCGWRLRRQQPSWFSATCTRHGRAIIWPPRPISHQFDSTRRNSRCLSVKLLPLPLDDCGQVIRLVSRFCSPNKQQMQTECQTPV